MRLDANPAHPRVDWELDLLGVSQALVETDMDWRCAHRVKVRAVRPATLTAAGFCAAAR